MTDKEKAIVMAHTGICMLTGDKFQIFHKYVEDIMGRPILTHEIGFLADTIKEKSKADFIALCADCTVNDILDKVREEILDTLYVDSLIFGELIDFRNGKISADDVIEEFNRVTRLEVLKILDKYRAEKEVDE